MEQYVLKDNRKLRWGYTTGSCAAAAAQRAAAMALGASFGVHEKIILDTPKGVRLELPAESTEQGDGWAACTVKKDSGDDPDITNGILVTVKASKGNQPHAVSDRQTTASSKFFTDLDPESCGEERRGPVIFLEGGTGVGKVTKPGLAVPVGETAINPVPRRMIIEQVRMVCDELDYHGELHLEVSIPQGVEIAKRTYNPRLGIEGGISILGTSGIVEPMSDQALIDTIKVEMNVRKAEGAEYLVITPGNYGETFLKRYMNENGISSVKCSNFIGEALDFAESLQIKGVLLVGHVGKLVKVAAGMMNTHSKFGDARMEILGAHAAMAGASKETIKKLMDCITTEEAILVLEEAGVWEQTLQSVLKKLEFHIKERVHHNLEVGAILFSNQIGYLGETADAQKVRNRLSLKE